MVNKGSRGSSDYLVYHTLPAPALPVSGTKGMISARNFGAPLICHKGKAVLTEEKNLVVAFIFT